MVIFIFSLSPVHSGKLRILHHHMPQLQPSLILLNLLMVYHNLLPYINQVRSYLLYNTSLNFIKILVMEFWFALAKN